MREASAQAQSRPGTATRAGNRFMQWPDRPAEADRKSALNFGDPKRRMRRFTHSRRAADSESVKTLVDGRSVLAHACLTKQQWFARWMSRKKNR
jgi:hypothetical protein